MIETELLQMVESETAGDPTSEHKWVRSSLRKPSQRLCQSGHGVSAATVGRLLEKQDYALHDNAKEKEAGSEYPERDQQFQYLEAQKQASRTAG